MTSTTVNTPPTSSPPTNTSTPHVHFAPLPARISSPPSFSSSPPPKSAERKPGQDFDDILRPKQMTSMADMDKEEASRLAKSHRQKAKKVGTGVLAWVVGLRKK